MEATPIDFNRWYDATHTRKSLRIYEGSPTEGECQRLALLVTALQEEDIRILLLEATPKLFSGLTARNIKGVSYMAALITRPEAKLNRVGFKGEALVLECTAMGLGTCWMAGTFHRGEAKRLCDLQEGETLQAIITIGKATVPPDVIPDEDRKRKPLEKLVVSQKGTSLADMQPWQNTAFKCAKIAPSAMNMQPWRFAFAPNHICMVASGLFGAGAELDLGIAMLHIELGAATHGVRGSWAKDGTVWVFSVLSGKTDESL